MAGRLDGKRALIYGAEPVSACLRAGHDQAGRVFITGRREEKWKLPAIGWAGIMSASAETSRGSRTSSELRRRRWPLGGIDTLVVSSGRSTIGTVVGTTPAEFRIL